MEDHQWTTQDYLYVVAECVTGGLSIAGNALVLLAILRTRALQTVTNCFIASLATADILVGVVLPPTVILPYRGLPDNFHGCVLINTVVVLITNISILNLLSVALERYLAISDPFRYTRVMSIRRALVVVAVTWVVAIVLGLLPTMGWNLGQADFQYCSFTSVIDMAYMVYLIFFGVTVPPLVCMLIIYLYIFRIVRKQQRAVVAQLSVLTHDAQRVARKQRREVRGAKGLAYVIVLFAVCWLPIHILNSVTLFAPEHAASLRVHLVAIVLSHANSFINPFLYAFSSSHFKRAMLRLVFCGRCRGCYPVNPDDSMMSRVLPTATRKHSSASQQGDDVNGSNLSLYPRYGTGVLNRAFSLGDSNKRTTADKAQVSVPEGGRQDDTQGEAVTDGRFAGPLGDGEEVRDSAAAGHGDAVVTQTTEWGPGQGESQTVCGNGHVKHTPQDGSAARHSIFVVSVGDPAPLAQNGLSGQLGLKTQTSVLSTGRPHSPAAGSDCSDSKTVPRGGESEESDTGTAHSPMLNNGGNEEVTRIDQFSEEGEKVERLNWATETAKFVSIRL